MKQLILFLIRKFILSPKKFWLCVLIFFLNLFTVQYTLTEDAPSHDEFNPSTGVVYTVSDIREYRENCLLTAKNAQNTLNVGFSEKDSDYIYNSTAFDLYSALAKEVTSVTAVENRFFDYNYSIFYLVVFCFILTASLFGDDIDSGMQILTWSAKNGRKQLAGAKLIVLLCGITLAVCMTEVSGLMISGGVPLSVSVQSLPGMALCPLRITVLQYFILSCFLKILLLFCLSCIAASVYVLLSHVTYSALALALTCGVSYALSLIKTNSIYSPANYISPYSLALVSPIFSRYRIIALFSGKAHVTSWKFQIFVLGIFVVLLSAWLMTVLCRHRPGSAALFSKQQKNTVRDKARTVKTVFAPTMSLFRHELYKTSSGGGILVVLTVCALVILLPFSESRETHYTERIYKNYVESYSGKATDEAQWHRMKADSVEYEAERLAYETKLWQSADGLLASGEITSDEYTEIMNLYGGSEIKAQIFEKVIEYSDYLTAKSAKYDVGMVYDTGWNKLLSSAPNYLVYLAITFLASGIFPFEYGYAGVGGMADIVKTTKYGRRKLFYKKLKVSVLLGLLLGVFSETVRVCFILMQYDLPLAGLPVQSLMIFSSFRTPLTIAAASVISVFLRILSVLCFSVLVCMLSAMLKTKLPSMCLSVIAVLVSTLAKSVNIACPTSFMSGNITVDSTLVTSLIYLMLTACFIFIGYLKWKGDLCHENEKNA